MLKKIFSDNVFEKIVLFMFILTSLFLLSVSLVIGAISIDSVDIPLSVEENNDLAMSFSATTDTPNDIIYTIYQNNVLVFNETNAGDFTTFMNYSSAGIYSFKFVVSDGIDTVFEIHTITVVNVPMQLSLSSPVTGTYNTRTISVNALISTYADQCIYRLNNSMIGVLAGSNQNFNGIIDVGQDGRYILYVNCSNNFDTIISSVAFTVDTVNPVILSKSYVTDINNFVTISASTDVNCNCRYDAVDRSYDSMSATFTNTNGVQHSVTLSGLSDGVYTYYIKCKNYNNMFTNTEVVSFSIVNKPTASISLSKSSPIKAGTYEVSLTTSKPVISAPSLYYNFDTNAAPRYVTLTGSGTSWRGYMIIGEDTPNLIGTFHYSGTDQNNNVGTIISSGEIFLVDTTKPIPPSSFTTDELADGTIKLKWYYDGEKASRYNIYRSTNGNPEYVDYYSSIDAIQYVDREVIDGITYYYRIAAVDAAGNDGILSGVLQATSNKRTSSSTISSTTDSSPVVQEILDSALVPKVDQLVIEFETYLTDITVVKSELDEVNDPNKLKIINTLKLSDNTKVAQTTIKGLIEQTKNLKNKNLKASELDVQLNKLRMDAVKAKSLVAEDIIINEQSSYDQVTQESDVNQAIAEVVLVNLSRAVLNNYSSTNKLLQDNIVVNTDILIFRIKYLGKDDYDKYTLVKKVVSSSQELKDVSIIEIIPKSFESKASDIDFKIAGQQEPIIVKEDPVLRWDVATFNKQTIYYMINSNAELSAAKDTKTLVLYKPDFKVTQTTTAEEDVGTNRLTGFVSLDSVDLSKISFIQWLVFIGMGLILGLSAYYVTLDRKEKKRATQRLKDHKIISKPLSKNISQQVQQPVQSIRKTVSVPVAPIVTPVTLTELNGKLDMANNRINNFDYENARILYNECMQNYTGVQFKKASDKNDVKVMLNHLYIKLAAYRIIYDSRKHVTTRNYSLLRQDITEISKICNKLYASLSSVDEDHKDEEKKFIDYVSNSKRHLESIAS